MEELQRLVEKAVPFLEVGDGGNALRILEPIAEAFVDDWLEHSFGADEHLYELFADLGLEALDQTGERPGDADGHLSRDE